MFTVRDAEIEDAKRLLEIYSWYVVNTAVSFDYEPPTLEEYRQKIIDVKRKYPFIVLENDGYPVGFAYAGPFVGRSAYFTASEVTIYIDPAWHLKGGGRALYGALEARLKAQGIRNLYACIGYPETEDEYLTRNSAEFHEHMGFRLAGRFTKCGYKFGRWYDMIWMEKFLVTVS